MLGGGPGGGPEGKTAAAGPLVPRHQSRTGRGYWTGVGVAVVFPVPPPGSRDRARPPRPHPPYLRRPAGPQPGPAAAAAAGPHSTPGGTASRQTARQPGWTAVNIAGNILTNNEHSTEIVGSHLSLKFVLQPALPALARGGPAGGDQRRPGLPRPAPAGRSAQRIHCHLELQSSMMLNQKVKFITVRTANQ